MSTSLEINVQKGKPAIVQIAPGSNIESWAGENRDALHASVTEHGAVLVRGLGLQDASGIAATFRELATDLISDREPFAGAQQDCRGCVFYDAMAAWSADVYAQ